MRQNTSIKIMFIGSGRIPHKTHNIGMDDNLSSSGCSRSGCHSRVAGAVGEDVVRVDVDCAAAGRRIAESCTE